MPSSRITNSHEYTKYVLQINDKLSLFFNRRKKEKLRITNPFVYVWDIKWYQWIKMGIFSVTIFPIRAFLMTLFFTISFSTSYIATYNHIDNVPITGWRKKILMPIFVAAARLTFFFGSLQWVKVKGQRSSRESVPILVVGPHSAFVDALIVVHLGMNSVLGKMETARSIVGCFLKMTQPILVNRDDPYSRINTLQEIERRCYLPDEWPQIVIFPEGTCTNRTCLIDFKTGAFKCGLPVQPVVVRWPNNVDSVTWTWEGPGVLTLLWMCLTQFHTYLEIEFLQPYYPSEEEKEKPKLFANNVRDVMAKSLQIPTTDYSYEDCRHMVMAKQAGLPFSEIVVEINNLSKFLTEEYQIENNVLNRLVEINRSFGPKKISSKELSAKLDLKGSLVSTLDSLFKFYDKTKSGTIFLRELVSHMSFFMLPFNRKLAFTFAVQCYKDSIMLDECTVCNDVLRHVFLLSVEEVNELFTLIQSNSINNSITIDSIEETMNILGGPFNMYVDYFTQYNRSKRFNVQQQEQQQLHSVDTISTNLLLDNNLCCNSDQSNENSALVVSHSVEMV